MNQGIAAVRRHAPIAMSALGFVLGVLLVGLAEGWRVEALACLVGIVGVVDIERRQHLERLGLRLELCPRFSREEARVFLTELSVAPWQSPRMRAAVLARLAATELETGRVREALERFARLRRRGWRAYTLMAVPRRSDEPTMDALATMAVLEIVNGHRDDGARFLARVDGRGAPKAGPTMALLRAVAHLLDVNERAARDSLAVVRGRDAQSAPQHIRAALEVLHARLGPFVHTPYRRVAHFGDSASPPCWLELAWPEIRQSPDAQRTETGRRSIDAGATPH